MRCLKKTKSGSFLIGPIWAVKVRFDEDLADLEAQRVAPRGQARAAARREWRRLVILLSSLNMMKLRFGLEPNKKVILRECKVTLLYR